ncbi:membrane hypothetical protein [Gammaproteobacteria bacterium]
MRRKRDYSQMLLFAALLVLIPRYAGAFIYSDASIVNGLWSEIITVFMALSGVGMGFLDVLGISYIVDGWRHNIPATGKPWPIRFKILTAVIVSLLLVTVGILAPFTIARVMTERMNVVMPFWALGLWAIAVNTAPILLIGGLVLGQSGVVGINASTEPTPIKHNAEVIHSISMHQCKQCKEEFRTVPALASHVRWQHANHKQAERIIE